MDCPVCKDAMVVLELQDVEIDYCFGCSGIWLDAGELEMLIDDADKAAALLKAFKADPQCTEARRRCPICDRKMDKVVIGYEKPQLLIDQCSRMHGLWFDGGELQDILKRAQLGEDSKIQQLLAEMFKASNQ